MEFNFNKREYDLVLVYENQEGLAEAVYKSESPKLYQDLIDSNKNVFYFETFKEQNREGIKRRIELMLWKLNLKTESAEPQPQLEGRLE